MFRKKDFTFLMAQAAMDGRRTIKLGDVEVPVTMSKQKAIEIMNNTNESALRSFIKETLKSSSVFGSGMEQADLTPDQAEIIGHT